MSEVTLEFKVDGMGCTACVNNVEKALSTLPQITHVQVSLEAGKATIKGTETLKADQVVSALSEAGYEAQLS